MAQAPVFKSVRQYVDERNARLVAEGGVFGALTRLEAALSELGRQYGTPADQKAHDDCVGYVRASVFRRADDLGWLLRGGQL